MECPFLASSLLRAAHGLRLLRVATTTTPPFFVIRNNSATALLASAINSRAVIETTLSKDFSRKGRIDISPHIGWKRTPPDFSLARRSIGKDISSPMTCDPEKMISRVNTPVPQPASRTISPGAGFKKFNISSLSYFLTREPIGVVNHWSYFSGHSSKIAFSLVMDKQYLQRLSEWFRSQLRRANEVITFFREGQFCLGL